MFGKWSSQEDTGVVFQRRASRLAVVEEQLGKSVSLRGSDSAARVGTKSKSRVE